MNLITYELYMPRIDGTHWWAKGDERVTDDKLEAELEYMHASDRYRNIEVGPDPHDDHPASAIDSGMTGMYVNCTVPGCTWSKDYD